MDQGEYTRMRNYLKFITESSWPKSPHLYNAPLLIVTQHSAENEQETGQKKVLTKSEKTVECAAWSNRVALRNALI